VLDFTDTESLSQSVPSSREIRLAPATIENAITRIAEDFMRNCLPLFLLVSSLAASQPPVRGIAPTPDVALAYEVYGAPSPATPIIVVNGGPGFSHKYLLQNDVFTGRLAHNRQVVLYDQRGDGESKLLRPNAPQDMNAQVADLEAVRVKLGLNRFDLMGHSWGGLLAMAYASAHPEHIEKFILVDSAAPAWKDTIYLFDKVFPDVAPMHWVGASQQRGQQSAATDPLQGEHLAHFFDMLFYSEQNRAGFLAHIGDPGESKAVNQAVGESISTVDLTANLPHFNFPALIITGRYDMNVAPLTAWKMYKAIPGAGIAILEKSGHLPFYEEPERFSQIVNDFLSQ
jgi:proline iminopeptidase